MESLALIRQMRLAKGLTQGELGERASASLATIQNIEAGTANPSLRTVSKICEVLDLSFGIQVQSRNEKSLSDLLIDFTWTIERSARKNFKRALLEAVSTFYLGSMIERDRDILMGVALALLDHFPSWTRKVKLERELLKMIKLKGQTDPNRLIKFRRLSLEHLAKVL